MCKVKVWKLKKRVREGIYALALTTLALAYFSPVLWMLSTSLKPTLVAITENPPRWIPRPFTFDNFRKLFVYQDVGIRIIDCFFRSLVVAVAYATLVLVVSIPCAYAFARFRFPGRQILFWGYVATLAFPYALYLIPNFFIVKSLRLLDTMWALILPGLGGTFGVFMLRQYMLGIPHDLEDAAWIDGCSKLRFMLVIAVPLTRPAILVLWLMSFLSSWNSLFWPLIVLNKPTNFTLPIAIVRLQPSEWGDLMRGIGVMMAASFFAVGPALALFIAFRNKLIKGISLGAIGK